MRDEGGSRFFSSAGGDGAGKCAPFGRAAAAAYRRVMGIAMPAIAEMVLISLIGSLDTIMVGQLGKNCWRRCPPCPQPRMIMLALFFALNVGVLLLLARRKGQGLRRRPTAPSGTPWCCPLPCRYWWGCWR